MTVNMLLHLMYVPNQNLVLEQLLLVHAQAHNQRGSGQLSPSRNFQKHI